MFNQTIYISRRNRLHKLMKSGIALFPGNNDAAMNYPANPYHFRQDSDFLYFFGLDLQGFAGIMDFDSGEDRIFGNDADMDDIIWMGPQPTVKELAAKCGVSHTSPMAQLEEIIREATSKRKKNTFSSAIPGRNKNDAGLASEGKPLPDENSCFT